MHKMSGKTNAGNAPSHSSSVHDSRHFPLVLLLAVVALPILLFSFDTFGVRSFLTGFPGGVTTEYNGKTVPPLAFYIVSYGYGMRNDPITGKPDFHTGMDLSSFEGMAVRAVKDGNIVRIEKEGSSSLGNWVEVQHPDGTFTVYAHLSAFGNIHLGENIGAGSVIGAVGNTGRSMGPHLHFELHDRDGQPMDPASLGIFLPAMINTISSSNT